MAKISNTVAYPSITNLDAADYLVITDAENNLVTKTATIAQIHHENRRADGPRDAAEQTLRPLPGTTAGDDGWYFDREGRPSHWSHSEENGWVQE